jgi:hypothetical protein
MGIRTLVLAMVPARSVGALTRPASTRDIMMGCPSLDFSSPAAPDAACPAETRLETRTANAAVLSKTPVASWAARYSTAAASLAEIACNELEDARINFSRIASNATPTGIGEAKRRLQAAKAVARIATKANLLEQATLYAQSRAALEAVDKEMAASERPAHDSDRQKLAALADRRSRAGAESWERGKVAAVAWSLWDIVTGARPGRIKLARETGLMEAETADARRRQVHELLVFGEFRSADDAGVLISQYRQAASASRAEWAAAHDNAMDDPDLRLRDITESGLASAEEILLFEPRFDETKGRVFWSLAHRSVKTPARAKSGSREIMS